MTTSTRTRQVRLVCGADELLVDLPEHPITAAELLKNYATTLNIPPAGGETPRQIVINEARARESQPIQPGDTVEVLREATEKG
jgi:hypothetical protein